MGFFSSLFSSSKKDETTDNQKNDKKNFDILKYDGIRALQIRQVDYAIRCFTEALNIQQDLETMQYLVSAYTMDEDTDSALEVLEEMVVLEPEDPNIYLKRVNILFMADKDIEAIPDCEKAIELDADNYLAYFLLAKAKRATGDLADSITNLTKAIALKEDFADGHLIRAEVLYELKQGEEAMEDIEKVISLMPEEETAYLLRGRIHQLLGDIESAANDFQLAIELNPFHEDAYILKGQLLIDQQKYDEAISVFDEAIEHNEQSSKAYSERGRAKALKGDDKGAQEDRETALELNPEGEDTANHKQANFDDLYKGGIF